MNTIAETIKDLRKQKGISQEQLAEDILVSRQTISKWEQGLVLPSMENLIVVCKYFNVDLSCFFDADTAVAEQEKIKNGKKNREHDVVADWLFTVMLIIFGLLDVVLGTVVVAFGCIYFSLLMNEHAISSTPVDLGMFILAIFFFCIVLGLTIFTIVKFVQYKRTKEEK